MVYNNILDFHMALATGDDSGAGAGLTAWRNADVKLDTGECIPCDLPLGWSFKPPIFETTKTGSMSSARVPHRFSQSVRPGEWKSKHAFQTCQFIWWIMQTAGTPTSEDDPGAGYHTHTITISAVSAPLWHGIHFERESIGSAELRYDLLGILPMDWDLNCGESVEGWAATQEISLQYAYLQTTCDDIAAQTPRPTSTTGSIWKEQPHAVAGGGLGLDPAGLDYNSNNLEVDITRLHINLHRDVRFTSPDVNGFYIGGLMQGFDYSIDLDVIPIGDLLYDVNKEKKEDYAGDLDYIFSFTADATNDKVTFTFDKMYMTPFDEINDYNQYIEGYTIHLEPLDTTSSLNVVGIDNLDNTHFENP